MHVLTVYPFTQHTGFDRLAHNPPTDGTPVRWRAIEQNERGIAWEQDSETQPQALASAEARCDATGASRDIIANRYGEGVRD